MSDVFDLSAVSDVFCLFNVSDMSNVSDLSVAHRGFHFASLHFTRPTE